MKLPAFLGKYFWESSAKLDPIKSKKYIIAKLLDLGDQKAIKWLFGFYKKKDILSALTESRLISKKSANFWASYFKVPKEKIKCLQKPSPEKPKKLWKY